MTPEELATFLREEVPHLWEYHSVKGELKLTGDAAKEWADALTAAVGLLREAESSLIAIQKRSHILYRKEEKLLATLRLVVGEKEMA